MAEGDEKPGNKETELSNVKAASSAKTASDLKEPAKQPQEPASPYGKPAVLLFALTAAIIVACVQQKDIAEGNPMALFEPHVVPPPKASKNEVVIQFCQS
jgi:hypothetical protein